MTVPAGRVGQTRVMPTLAARRATAAAPVPVPGSSHHQLHGTHVVVMAQPDLPDRVG